ncbi:SMC family ATPase [Enterococcus sp. DIV1298c]|uniref:AAA family ATPase n=1 Tax=Enterococcus sp. DIV1298c TaxID=2815328 RepID=UPI001A935301|nr:SMC family ATPase [Enterococcus sp. DIV1298c]MBO0461671.1 SMC family ATPase [Enterococcus sp. DIV1298c]
MKPQTLRLKNFGPFINETIDFSKLTQASLFLITGKTGAGKTTIFDGMTYALFGETSGRLRSGKEMRSLFATPEDETIVLFSFEHQQLRYEIERKPEQLLAKRKGEGMRKQAAKVSLTIFDEKGKEIRQLTKRSEVDQEIKELLNLDAKQFAQIVLLPQGEFRNFLISSSSEKETVLRNLFGTQFFQRFNEQLKEKAKNKQKELDHLEQELVLLQRQFSSHDEQQEAGLHSFETVINEWEEQQAQIATKIATEQEVLEQLKEEQKISETDYYHGKNQQSAYEEKQKLLGEQQELNEQQLMIEEKQRWLTRYELAQKLRTPLERSEEYQGSLAEQNEEQQQLTTRFDEVASALQNWQEQQETRENLEQKIAKMSQALQDKQRLIPVADAFREKQSALSELEKAFNELQQQTQQLATEQLILQEKQQESQTILATQGKLQEEQLAYERLRLEEERYCEQQQRLEQLEKELGQNHQQLEQATEQLLASQKLLEQQTQEFKQCKSDWAKSQIAYLQTLLVPGEPCPVCGATEHPLTPDHHDFVEENIAVLEENMTRAEKAIEKTHQEIGRKEAEIEEMKQQLARLKQQQLETSQQLEQQAVYLSTELKAIFQIDAKEDIARAFAEIEKNLKDRLQKIKEAEEAQVTIVEELASNQEKSEQVKAQQTRHNEKIQRIQGELAGLSQQLGTENIDTLAKEADQLVEQVVVNKKDLEVQLTQGEKLQQESAILTTKIDTLTEQIAKTTAQVEKEQRKITGFLEQHSDFSSQEAVAALLQDTATYEHAKTMIKEYQTKQLVLSTRLEQLKHVTFDENPQDLTVLSEQIEKIKQAIEEQQQLIYHLQQEHRNNQRVMVEYTTSYQNSQEQLDELVELQQLSQTMNGENPKKTSIERYVLQVYLQEVLQVANEHLMRLTKSRYQFELDEEVGSYRGKTGLEINVYDDEAGTTRGSHTLSGGESFIAALSLALALAEVIQAQAGGITIEALFIDEGFGSLDEEALEMAMEALETVESEGRMIGIISHVRELKERVLQQIRIDTKGSGQSEIRYHFG